jgi:hypothetical protein
VTCDPQGISNATGAVLHMTVATIHKGIVFPTTAEAQSATGVMAITDGGLQFQVIPQTGRVTC